MERHMRTTRMILVITVHESGTADLIELI